MSEKIAKVKTMRELVADVAGPMLPGDTTESWLRRAARNADTTYRQAKALYYDEITDPYHRTVTKFKEAAGRYEARNLAGQFERIASGLATRDEDFHSADIDSLLFAARLLRGLDRAGNGET